MALRVAERILDLIRQTPLLRLVPLQQRVLTIIPDGRERSLSKGIVEVPSEVTA